ncbi:MAG: tyrosine--tRNA ligase, partial [Oscillospiraceae bacterium]|nr:tyrosine--tRNA ligase [Oscillospiraceae bacterium]
EAGDEGVGIIDLMIACGLAASRGEARRLIQQGGVSLDGEKVTSQDLTVSAAQLREGVKIRKGKKIFHKAVLK